MTRLALEARVGDSTTEYAFETEDGVHSTDELRPAELALLDALWDRSADALLCVEANYGVVPTVLADAHAVTATESSARAVRLCERNARANGVRFDVEPCLSQVDGSFGAAAYAPKPYTPLAVAKHRLVDALSRLEPDGALVVAGTRESGIERYADFLDSETERVERREIGGVTVIEATGPSAYESTDVLEQHRFTATVDGTTLSLVSTPGVFAAGALDHGTRLLLESVSLDGGRVLDLCCGYGAIGTYAAKAADCDVVLTDDDAVSVGCARRSLSETDVDARVVHADATRGVSGPFDRVLCNPPTHAGRGVLRDLFAGARDVLAPDGTLTVVHHRALDLALPGFDAETVAVGEEHVVRSDTPDT